MIKRNKDHGNITHWFSFLFFAGALAFVSSIFSAGANELPNTKTLQECLDINIVYNKTLQQLDDRIKNLEEENTDLKWTVYQQRVTIELLEESK